jgi:diacylglycerol kinase family enzyme
LLATLALVAGAATVAALVWLALGSLPGLFLALAGLSLAGAAGWYAATRRGVSRLLGIACIVAALGGGTAALIAFGLVGELLLLAVAAVAFAAISWLALDRGSDPGTSQSAAATRIVRPRRGVLILNPFSGGGKVESFNLVAEARSRGIEPIVFERGDDLRALADDAAQSAEVIGMAGGDGSQALVAGVAMEHGLPYVSVAAGTRNHFAHDLGLDRVGLVDSLDAFVAGNERRIDLGMVNGRIFVNNVSLGIYAEIVQSDAYRGAKRKTVEQMLPDLLGPDATPFDLRFRTPDGDEQQSAQLVLVSNNAYVLDQVGAIGSRPRLDTGRLGIVAIDIENAADAAELIALNALLRPSAFRGWREWTAQEFEVESAGLVAAGIDGEATMLEPPLRFSVLASALTVLVPPAAGLSRAALRPGLSRSTLHELWQIAAGRR